jgi:hypothetical protein
MGRGFGQPAPAGKALSTFAPRRKSVRLFPARAGPHKYQSGRRRESAKKTPRGNAESASHSFADFLTRLQAADADAVHELFRGFTGQLIALARRRVEGGLRHKVDPEDVVQSAYKSFFASISPAAQRRVESVRQPAHHQLNPTLQRL